MRSHVLLVEDEPLVARGLVRGLRDRCDVHVAATAAAGIEAITMDRRWDAIVADIGLPDGSGLEVLAAAKRWRPGVPLLAVTGDITNSRVNEAFELGARVVAKPVRAWMIRALLSGDYRLGICALFACLTRYPDRWEESVIAFAISKLEDERWRTITASRWPDVLDALDRDLRAALPPGLPRHRRGTPIH